MNPDLFAGRYELLHEAPPGAAGRLFQARDAQTGEYVGVKVFRRELPAEPDEHADLQRVFSAAEACRHPRILRYHTLSTEDGYVVREWIHGFPLVDLLRRRRELPSLEVATLLQDVPDTVDAAVAASIAPTGDLLTRLFVSWDRSLPTEELVRLRDVPVTEWQNFEVKLSPISLSHILPLSPEETMSTMVRPQALQAGPVLSPAAGFAELVYQLLGAPRRLDRHRRYVPLGTLNEAGNMLLREIVESRNVGASCTEFWQRFLDATGASIRPRKQAVSPPPNPIFGHPPQAPTVPPSLGVIAPVAPPPAADVVPPPAAMPPPLPKRRMLRIPDACLEIRHPGTILRLTPRDISFTPIHLIARPSFRIGRSLYHSDFITRILPETPENEKLTKEIGRVHVLAEVRDGQITLRDGNGEQASVNGSTFEGVALSNEIPLPVTHPGILSLYRHYELEITPLLGALDLGWSIENEGQWNGPAASPPPLSGAVAFRPLRDQPALRKAAWIFSRLDFTLSPRGDVVWREAGDSANHASFFYHRSQFWMAALAPTPGGMLFDGLELAPDAVIPMGAGHTVQLGSGVYMVEVQ